MDKEKLWKGNELIDQHERYDKVAFMLNMLLDYDCDDEPMTTSFKLAIADLDGFYKELSFCNNDVPLIKDLIRVVKEHDSKVLKEFEDL